MDSADVLTRCFLMWVQVSISCVRFLSLLYLHLGSS